MTATTYLLMYAALRQATGVEDVQENTNICLSGGADGADIEWGTCAHSVGHRVIHWSFQGHDSNAPEDQIICLNDEQLAVANEALKAAAQALGKSPPRRPGVVHLLQRNYYQVAYSNACYAVTTIQNDVLPAGTAWTTTMFEQLHPGNPNLYLFDQQKDAWFQFNGGTWVPITCPSRPTGVWAGIGSRDLKLCGLRAIREVMGCSKNQVPGSNEESVQPLVSTAHLHNHG